ncbi:MAG: AAA family ATPase [Proteobacteria bacterium]|nr:AAA family ATPase [Pseudomonadota bacterium]
MEKKLIKALNNFRVIMLNGPRQSGKTTLVKKIVQKIGMNYITLDDPDKLEFARTDPENFLAFYAKKPLAISTRINAE